MWPSRSNNQPLHRSCQNNEEGQDWHHYSYVRREKNRKLDGFLLPVSVSCVIQP